MLVRNLDLLIESLFFVDKLAHAVLNHLLFDLSLLHEELLLELATALELRRRIHGLRGEHAIEFKSAKTKKMGHQLLLSNLA